MSEGRSSPHRAAVLTCVFCLLWAAAMLWPALGAPGDRILMDIGDPVLNASILEWNARTLPLSEKWWNFPAFAPADGISAFTEHLLGLYPVAAPLTWLTGHPIVAYDLVCLVSFPLTGVAMFALARRITGSDIGGFAGALALTFSPYRVSHLSHIQMLWTFGIPLALLGLHQWADERTRRGLVLFAAGWLFTAASNGYLMVFFGIYLLFWIAWFCTTRATVDRLPGIGAAWLLASLPLVPLLAGYVQIHRRYGLERSAGELAGYSADISGLLRPWHGLAFVPQWIETAPGEGALYPGVAIVMLALAGISGRSQTAVAQPRTHRWIRHAALATAALFLAAAAVAALTDVRYDVGFARLTISNAGKPLTFGLVALLAALAMSGRSAAVLRTRSPALFHALMVPVVWVLSLGPVARLNGVEVVRDLPYRWLLDVPGMMALRVPARFWLLGAFSLALLAACGAARLSAHRAGRVLVVAAVALMLVEGWADVQGAPVNPFPAVAPVNADAGPVLELPLERVDQNTVAVLRAVTGGYETMNGYSGFDPPHFGPLRFGIRVRDSAVLDEMRRRTPFHVSAPSDDADGLRTWIANTQPAATLVAERSGRALYALPRLPSIVVPPGRNLPFARTRASCGHALLPDLSDASLVTRWECGPGHPGQFVEADLGTAQLVSGIVNTLGSYTNDAPRSVRVTVSGDGERWITAWEGPTAGFALRAAFEDPARVDVRIRFPPVRARHVRITQTGDRTEWFWSIAELSIIGD
jgi:hypothetical protein